MRFTFYSAVSLAALMAQQTAIALEVEPETQVDEFAQLDDTPVYEEEANFA